MRGAIDIESGALILTVDAAALERLVRLMETSEAAIVKLDSWPVRPATRPIQALRIEAGVGDVTVECEDCAARLSGSPEGFARMARELEEFAEHNDLGEPGMHAHFDPGVAPTSYGVLSADSVSLIIAGPVPDDSDASRS